MTCACRRRISPECPALCRHATRVTTSASSSTIAAMIDARRRGARRATFCWARFCEDDIDAPCHSQASHGLLHISAAPRHGAALPRRCVTGALQDFRRHFAPRQAQHAGSPMFTRARSTHAHYVYRFGQSWEKRLSAIAASPLPSMPIKARPIGALSSGFGALISEEMKEGDMPLFRPSHDAASTFVHGLRRCPITPSTLM